MQAVRFTNFCASHGQQALLGMVEPLLISSFGEKHATETLALSREWARHNMHACSRVYPRGRRVDSSNVDRQLACALWEAGQLVESAVLVALQLGSPASSGRAAGS